MGIRRMIGRTTLVVAALAVTAPLAACGPVLLAGPRATQERDIAGVSALDLRTSGDLTVTVGETESLTITAASHRRHRRESRRPGGHREPDERGLGR